MTLPAKPDGTSTEGLEALFRAHYERVVRVIGRVIREQARSEELAVDIFLRWQRNPQAHGPGAEGWLYRTAVREALDELRRQVRREKFERLFSIFGHGPPTPQELAEVREKQQRVRTVLASLKRQSAEVLIYWSHGMNYREIATSMEVQLNYVGSLVSRAQEEFRKEYVEQYGSRS